MFEKYNFNNYLLLSVIIVFILGSNYQHYNEGLDVYFGKQLIALSVLAIGIYGIFIENEIMNTSIQVQSIVIGILTEAHLVYALEDIFGYKYHDYLIYPYIALIALTSYLSTKYFGIIERFFRFSFIYSIGIIVFRGIPYASSYKSAISLTLGIAAIFANFLSFNRISIISSCLTFSLMIQHGFDHFIRSIFTSHWVFHYRDIYVITLNLIQGFIFVKASILQLRNSGGNNQELPGSGQNYSTFSN